MLHPVPVGARVGADGGTPKGIVVCNVCCFCPSGFCRNRAAGYLRPNMSWHGHRPAQGAAHGCGPGGYAVLSRPCPRYMRDVAGTDAPFDTRPGLRGSKCPLQCAEGASRMLTRAWESLQAKVTGLHPRGLHGCKWLQNAGAADECSKNCHRFLFYWGNFRACGRCRHYGCPLQCTEGASR